MVTLPMEDFKAWLRDGDTKRPLQKGDVPGHEFHGNQWTNEGGGTLYHGTSKERAAAIMTEGLKTSKGGEVNPSFSGKGKIYLATTKEEAQYWAQFHHGKENATVLSVNVPKEFVQNIKPDPNYTFMPRGGTKMFVNEDKKISVKDIPASWINRIGKVLKAWLAEGDTTKPLEQSSGNSLSRLLLSTIRRFA
jgi:hypothetical protein